METSFTIYIEQEQYRGAYQALGPSVALHGEAYSGHSYSLICLISLDCPNAAINSVEHSKQMPGGLAMTTVYKTVQQTPIREKSGSQSTAQAIERFESQQLRYDRDEDAVLRKN